jgi:16S rRNA (adenine1518-N6/adenine1519-N6)-dimethyltransferase
MQTLNEIRALLEAAGLRPQKMFGQSFLIDRNLMRKLLELADLPGGQTVLEVGAATGSLTEELLESPCRVVAVEIDRGLFEILERRLGGRQNVTLIRGDVLAGKHAISPQVLGALGAEAHLVANLPYNVATPLVADCLIQSWRASAAGGAARRDLQRAPEGGGALFERLTFTVQQEVADRLNAAPGCGSYGPVSVIVSLLGVVTFGSAVPASAFWPRPKVASRIVRIDFHAGNAARLADVDALRQVVALAFMHRRKQIGAMLRRNDTPLDANDLAAGMEAARIGRTVRPQDITPEQYLVWSNAAARRA